MSLPARAIQQVQRVRAAADYGDVSWPMQGWTLGETFAVDCSGRETEFIDDVRALDPGLLVAGERPVCNPWDPGWAAISGGNERYCFPQRTYPINQVHAGARSTVHLQGKVP